MFSPPLIHPNHYPLWLHKLLDIRKWKYSPPPSCPTVDEPDCSPNSVVTCLLQSGPKCKSFFSGFQSLPLLNFVPVTRRETLFQRPFFVFCCIHPPNKGLPFAVSNRPPLLCKPVHLLACNSLFHASFLVKVVQHPSPSSLRFPIHPACPNPLRKGHFFASFARVSFALPLFPLVTSRWTELLPLPERNTFATMRSPVNPPICYAAQIFHTRSTGYIYLSLPLLSRDSGYYPF